MINIYSIESLSRSGHLERAISYFDIGAPEKVNKPSLISFLYIFQLYLRHKLQKIYNKDKILFIIAKLTIFK